MSEQLETQSLISLAVKNSPASRTDADVGHSRARAKAAERKGGFDGFLKTFLGNDKNAGHGKASGSSKGGGTTRMTRQERRAVRDAMEKTDAENEYVDEEIAAAAEEAAKIIWNLLHPAAPSPDPSVMPDRDFLAGLSGIMVKNGCADASSLTGMGAGGLGDAVGGEAVETANASAEMNMDAVLSSLDELLEGMPRSALRHALAGVAAANGRYDVFAEVAAALEAEVVEVNGPLAETDPGRILTELAMTAERQNAVAATANNSAFPDLDSDAYETFKQFLRDNFPNSNAASLKPKQLEDLFESISQRLLNANPESGIRGLLGEVGGLSKALTADFPKGSDPFAAGGGVTADKIFAWVKEDLESLLHDETGGGNSNNSGKSGNGQDNGALLSGQSFSGVMTSANAQAANAMNDTTAMNSMLEQMENIKRLAEAMKMANRGGVKNLTLQLAPVELGKVLLKVETRDGVVTASLRVEKAEAVAQLSSSLNQLRESLLAQGVQLGDVDIRQHDFGDATGDGNGHNGAQSPENSGMAGPGRAPADEDGTAANSESAIWQGSGLNLFA